MTGAPNITAILVICSLVFIAGCTTSEPTGTVISTGTATGTSDTVTVASVSVATNYPELAITQGTAGSVYYVSPDGDNSNPGTSSEPGAAPSYGSKQLEPGVEPQVSFMPNPHHETERRKGILTADLLASNDVDVLVVQKDMHRGGGYYALADHLIGFYVSKFRTMDETVRILTEND